MKLDAVKARLLRLRAALRRDKPDTPAQPGAGTEPSAVQHMVRMRAHGPVPGVRAVDDEIARQLAEAERRGELRSAPGYGQALADDAGWAQTPDDVRMPFKMLKSAGIVPHEVELLRERAALRAQLAAATTPEETRQAQQALAQVELTLALRLESLRR